MQQQLTVAMFVGKSVATITSLLERLRTSPDRAIVDRFSSALRDNRFLPQIVYFSEWVDLWLMGNLVPGPNAIEGTSYQIACFTPEEALSWADQCGHQFAEQEWLASRLREAAGVWSSQKPRVVVVLREVVAACAIDEQVLASFQIVPEWLSLL
jgi:hypothetical protein